MEMILDLLFNCFHFLSRFSITVTGHGASILDLFYPTMQYLCYVILYHTIPNNSMQYLYYTILHHTLPYYNM